jgi:hypothetical protein
VTSPTIEHEGPHSLVVSSLVPLTWEQVRSCVGSGWTVPAEWVNVIDGREVVKPNPFQRGGKYVWLLKKG